MRAIFPLLLAAASVAYAVEGPIPQRLPLETYDKLVQDWPFALATAPVDAGPPPEPIFQNIYLGSAGKISDGGVEKDWILLRDRSDAGRLVELLGNEPNKEGFKLEKVNWAEDPKNISATVSKDGKSEEIKTDVGAWAATGPVVQPGGPRPPVTGQRPGVPLPNGVNAIKPPANSNVQPQNRGLVIPRPANAPAPQAIKINPGGAPAAGTPHARTRVIPPPK
jgi:hypothetical protein